MVIVSLKITVPPDKRLDALQTVRPILGPTRVKPGCISTTFYQDQDDPDTLVLIEKWETQSELEVHIQSNEYRNILALMDLSTRFPEVKVKTVSKTEGLEFIKTVRGCGEIAASTEKVK
jgi:quinol monooxygenase YgiN